MPADAELVSQQPLGPLPPLARLIPRTAHKFPRVAARLARYSRAAAKARVLGGLAVAGVNSLLTSYSSRSKASTFCFKKRRRFEFDDRRSSFAFSFSNSETKRMHEGIFLSACDFVLQLAEDDEWDDSRPPEGQVALESNSESDDAAMTTYFKTDEWWLAATYGAVLGEHAPERIEADKISLPPRDCPPPVDMMSLLSPEDAAFYADPANLLLGEGDEEPSPGEARCCVMIDDEEYIKLLNMLAERGMITFLHEVEKVNGLFAVPKSDELQRLIADLRRSNSVFKKPEKSQLAGPDHVVNVQAPPGKTLTQATRDIRDYYHRIGLPKWMWPFMAWPQVDAAKIPWAAACGFAGMMFPCLIVLPMGFSHSVRIAQLIHERVVHHFVGVPREDQILASNDLRLREGRVLYNLYIDDSYWVSLSDPNSQRKLRNFVEKYQRELARLGLDDKPSKRWGPETGTRCVSLGMTIDGATRSYGMSAQKLEELKAETRTLMAAPTVSGRALARVVGKWNWAFLVRRPGMCTLAACYLYISALGDRADKLWNTVQQELRVAVQIAPLLQTQLDLPMSAEVFASDASTWGGGVVAKRVSPATRKNVLCLANKQQKLLPPFSEAETAEREPFLDPILWRGQDWRVIFSNKWHTRGEHITVLEMRAAYLAARAAFMRGDPRPHRHVFLVDSTAVVSAINKGRCKSRDLLRRLRPIMAIALATRDRAHTIFIESEKNPSDGPSRDRPIWHQLLPQPGHHQEEYDSDTNMEDT